MIWIDLVFIFVQLDRVGGTFRIGGKDKGKQKSAYGSRLPSTNDPDEPSNGSQYGFAPVQDVVTGFSDKEVNEKFEQMLVSWLILVHPFLSHWGLLEINDLSRYGLVMNKIQTNSKLPILCRPTNGVLLPKIFGLGWKNDNEYFIFLSVLHVVWDCET